MKWIALIMALLNGGFMLIDGIHVLLKGKYIGPEKPGPWANLFYKLNINVFNLGPLFICIGLLWLIWLFGFWTQQTWSYTFGIFVCVTTLWYLPVGTLFSVVILLLLLFARTKLGL